MLRRAHWGKHRIDHGSRQGIACVKADPGYVGQVLMNLVVNARDAMPNGGKLSIATRNATSDEQLPPRPPGAVAGHFVRLSVSDTGTGMSDEVKAHSVPRPFSPPSPRARAPVWAWPPAKPSSNNPAAISAWTLSRAKAPPSRFIFRRPVSRARPRPDRSRPGRCRAGRKPCWSWKMNLPSGTWRATY